MKKLLPYGLLLLACYLIFYKKEKITGGLADNRPDSDFDPIQLEKGIAVEMEHTNNPDIAKEIAKDHLVESKDYYIRLEKMEEGM